VLESARVFTPTGPGSVQPFLHGAAAHDTAHGDCSTSHSAFTVAYKAKTLVKVMKFSHTLKPNVSNWPHLITDDGLE